MPQTILLVDDDLALIDALRRALRQEPYEILTAGSAQEALAIMERRGVDVVVSDDQMPGVSGCAFLAHIRSVFPGTVRVMLSGQATPASMAKAINDGHIFRYLSKPCSLDLLAETVRQALIQKILLDRCREGLVALRRQTMVLQYLAAKDAEAVQRAIDAVAGVVITPDDIDTAAEMSEQMAVHVQHISALMPSLPASSALPTPPSMSNATS